MQQRTASDLVERLAPSDRRLLVFIFWVSPFGFFLALAAAALVGITNWAAGARVVFLAPQYLPFTLLGVVGLSAMLIPFTMGLRLMENLGATPEARREMLGRVWRLWWDRGGRFEGPGGRKG